MVLKCRGRIHDDKLKVSLHHCNSTPVIQMAFTNIHMDHTRHGLSGPLPDDLPFAECSLPVEVDAKRFNTRSGSTDDETSTKGGFPLPTFWGSYQDHYRLLLRQGESPSDAGTIGQAV